MKSSLTCQFCTSLVEFCNKTVNNITSDEMWIMLQIAKHNIEFHYSVIGIKQNIKGSLLLYEHYLPRFFQGMTDFVGKIDNEKSENQSKFEDFRDLLKDLDMKKYTHFFVQYEHEVYQFIVQRFHTQILKISKY